MPRRLDGTLVAALGLLLVLRAAPDAQAGDGSLPRSLGASAWSMGVVGALPLAGGIHGDAWVHRGDAYAGTWRQPECPACGVMVVNVSGPAAPAAVAALPQQPGTSQADMAVISVAMPTFRGDLLAVGLQRCARTGLAGVELGDVAVVVQDGDGAPDRMDAPPGAQPLGMPAAMISRADGARLKAALAAGGVVRMTLGAAIAFGYDHWGFPRRCDLSIPARPPQVGRFGAAPACTDRVAGPPDHGHYSAHHPIVDGTLVFASRYSDGVRAIDLAGPASPGEVGAFVPPPSLALSRRDQPGGPLAWSVAEQGALLYLSDMNSGLRIVRCTGGGAAPPWSASCSAARGRSRWRAPAPRSRAPPRPTS